MTTKPKARKFRIKRGSSAEMFRSRAEAAEAGQAAPAEARPVPGPAAAPAAPRPAATAPRPVEPADTPRPPRPEVPKVAEQRSAPERAVQAAKPPSTATAPKAAPESQPAEEGSTDLDTIKREGLTGRQLRMARRVAQKNNLPATSDFDAVRLLRERGIDPFARSNMLELVVPKGGEEGQGSGPVHLPQTIPSRRETLPSPELSPTQRREQEIGAIQRDIMMRRRRKMMLLMARLAFFVLLPTFVAGWYFYRVATPMYSTKSEFLILQADNVGGSGLGGLLSGTQFATSQDSIATQSFLQSKDAMLRLDRDVGFKSHFAQDWIDPIQRLGPDASNEEAYETYRKNVQIGYDPTEGVIRMEVIAADPAIASEYSRRLISYAEERVNHLSEQKRGDQMRDALQGFELAQQERRNAQEALVTLQQRGAVLDPEGVIAALRSQITNVETQLLEKQLQLAALEDNARPNQARVDGVRGDIERLESLLTDLNNRMVDASKGENSLAELNVRIQMAQADLSTRDLMLQSALQQVEQTRMEANRQVRYLTTSVEPVQSQEPSYPRKFENTILAFLIFSGIYLMLSLTASILREQVTS